MNKSFQIIPVLDLKDGLVVRGIRGEREKYQPVRSMLTASVQFSDVLAAFYNGFGFTEYYIADLDALVSGGERNQLGLIGQSHSPGASPVSFMVDAGVRDTAGAAEVLKAGAAKVIVGTETLLSLEVFKQMIDTFGASRLVASIDITDAGVLSSSPTIAGLTPSELIAEIYKTGIREFILLQLTRVGTGSGLDKRLIQECLHVLTNNGGSSGGLIIGGGVSGYDDLNWLADNGLGGALVASALHDGRLSRDAVRMLQRQEIRVVQDHVSDTERKMR